MSELVALRSRDRAIERARLGARPPMHVVLIAVALGEWAVSMRLVELDRMTGWGLVSVLPPTIVVALLLLCLGFAVGLALRLSPRLLMAYPAAILLVTQATVPLAYDTPRHAYAYKHIAVTRYITEHGSVDRALDIYHNWPGLFSACAALSRLTGVDAFDYANWAQVFFAVANALAVYFLARSLTRDRRRVVTTVWLYTLTAWLGPTYFAPQSATFSLTLLVFGGAIRWLAPRPGDGAQRVFRGLEQRVLAAGDRAVRRLPALMTLRLAGRPAAPPPARPEGEELPARFAVPLLLTLSAAIVVSHQLTPYFLISGLAALFVLGRSRTWLLPLIVAVLSAAWFLGALDFVSEHYSIFNFDLFSNLRGTQAAVPSAGSFEHQMVAWAGRTEGVLVVGLAVTAWWSGRPGRRDSFVWVMAATAASVLVVQPYGGEAIYRVYMFALPWLCFLGARVLVDLTGRWRQVAGAVSVVSGVAALLFLLGQYGLDELNHVRPQEVRASAWFEESTPPGSTLGLLVTNWPSPLTTNYPARMNGYGRWNIDIYQDPAFLGRTLTAVDIPRVTSTLRDAGAGGPVYLAIGPAQLAAIENYGYAPPGSAARFVDALLADPGLRVAYRDGDVVILELPQGPPS